MRCGDEESHLPVDNPVELIPSTLPFTSFRILLTTMAERDLTEDEVADLKEAFAMFDINGDGRCFSGYKGPLKA